MSINHETLSHYWRSINSQWHQRVHDLLETLNLTHVDRMVLMTTQVLTSPTKSDIAHSINVRPQSLTRSLKRMAENGYISKIVKESDQRAVYISLTEKGKKITHILEQQNGQLWETMFADFSETERLHFEKKLKTMHQNLLKK